MNKKESMRQNCLKKYDELMETIKGLPESKAKLRDDYQAVRALFEEYHQIPESDPAKEELRCEFQMKRIRFAYLPEHQKTEQEIEDMHEIIGRYMEAMRISPPQAYSDQRERETTS